MGPLFGVPMLLVEGDDDYRIWSQVPRHHSTSFSAIPCSGQKILHYQRALERVLEAIRSTPDAPSGYALVDGDKNKPAENPETPQRHIKFIQLNCYESENLFLADEVLQLMGLTWEDAKKRLTENASSYGQKAETLKSTIDLNRQRGDIKSVINELSDILDQKRLHWTIRVAKAIGKARPMGQIAEFLGSEVVDALWPPVLEAHPD